MTRNRWWWVVLGAIALLGFVGRVWNIDFDQRQHLHPDERHWALTSAEIERSPAPDRHGTLAGPLLDWLDGQRSPANPYRGTTSFVYGPVTLAIARGASGWLNDGVETGSQPAAAVAEVIDAFGINLIDRDGHARFDDGYGVDLVGRLLGAAFDTFTILVVALIARRLAGRVAGLAAGVFYASCVLVIQHAHFLGSEPLLGLACATTVLATLRLDRSENRNRAAATGVAAGLAAGTALAVKLSALGLVLVPTVAVIALLIRHRRPSDLVRVAAFIIGGAVAFRIANPAAFNGLALTPSTAFLDDVKLASRLGDSDLPPAMQWASRIPFVQPVVWLTGYTIGPGAVLASIVGAWVLIRRRAGIGRWPVFIAIASFVVPFVYTAATALPAGRYFVPMVPALCAVAGTGVSGAIHAASLRPVGVRRAVVVVAGIPVVLALLWGLAFVNGVYGETHTRIEASHWIDRNVPVGSVLSVEAWDDGLPLRLPGIDADAFTYEQFDLFGPDDVAKIEHLADQLATVDYVVESSPRVWGSVTRIPARFPSTIAFFDALDSGALGFERVATFTNHPHLLFWDLDTSAAEEAFTVYDAPEVRIWRRTSTVPRATIVSLLDPAAAATALPVHPNDAHANGLMLYEDELLANADGPTFREAFDIGGNPFVHIVGWFVLTELMAMAAFVLALPLLRTLPDAGLGIAKTVGLASVAFSVFVLSAWVDLPINRDLIALCVTALVGAGGLVGWRRRADVADVWNRRRPVLIAVELASAAVFAAFVALRAANPDLWHPSRGGEKPFELAVLTSVLRSESVPPYDPWFSGGSLNYYYGGWLMLTAPARLMRTTPGLTLNLGLGLFASCISGAAMSAGAAVAGVTRVRGRVRLSTNRSTVVAGLLSAGFVLLLSNLMIVRVLWNRVTGHTSGDVDWWGLSRVIPDSAAVTEFPAWSFLFGDLHPHLMGIALVLVAAVLAIAVSRALANEGPGASIGLAAVLGMVIGLVRATNTWDFPLALAMAGVAVITGVLFRAPIRRCLVSAAVIAIMVLVVWAPYSWRGLVFDAGTRLNDEPTPFPSWVQQFGLFAAVSVLAVLVHVRRPSQPSPAVVGRLTQRGALLTGLGFASAGAVLLATDRVVLVICTALTVSTAAVAISIAQGRRTGSALAAMALASGWAIQAGAEILTVRNDLGRMNTVFKFWYESWVLLAVGSAVVLAEQVCIAGAARRRTAWPVRFGFGLSAAAVVVSAMFWVGAAPVRLDDRVSDRASLDGEAFLEPGFEVGVEEGIYEPADDVPLIDWLRQNVEGIRAIAEAPGIDYRWTGRVSAMTGLPTPIGWEYHETQQRRPYSAAIGRRRDDMIALYQTTDPATMARVLVSYSIAYVVFGTQERLIASPRSTAAIRDFECLDVVATSGDLYVAAVDQACVNRVWIGG